MRRRSICRRRNKLLIVIVIYNTIVNAHYVTSDSDAWGGDALITDDKEVVE